MSKWSLMRASRERVTGARGPAVRCATCQWTNRSTAWFCAGCGEALAPRCRACKTDLVDGARFCDRCGEPVAALPAPAGGEPEPAEVAHDAEDGATADPVRAEEAESASDEAPLVDEEVLDETVRALLAASEATGHEDDDEADAGDAQALADEGDATLDAAEVDDVDDVDDAPDDEVVAPDLPGETRRERRVAANLATAAAARWAGAMRDADRHALATTYAPAYRTVDHAMHSTRTVAEQRLAEEEMLSTGPVVVELEMVASLGERHALYRFLLGWVGEDGETLEHDGLAVSRVEPDGAILSLDVFPGDELGRAAACLVERHALNELEEDDKSRALVTRLALRGPIAIGNGDWERFAAQFADATVLVDHRDEAVAVDDRDAIVAVVKALLTSTDGGVEAVAGPSLVDILALSAGATLVRWDVEGAPGAGVLWLSSFDAEGLVERAELFGVDQLDRAWDALEQAEASRSVAAAG